MNKLILDHLEAAFKAAKAHEEVITMQLYNAQALAEMKCAFFDSEEQAAEEGVYNEVRQKESELYECTRAVEKIQQLLADLTPC